MAKDPRIAARWAVICALKSCKRDVHRAAAQTRKSVTYVRRWKQRYLQTRNVNDRTHTGRPSKIQAATLAAAVTLVAEQQSVPAATAILKDQELLEEDIHVKTVLRAVKKKMDCSFVQQRPILSARTRAKRRIFSQQQHDSDSMIAIDSTYFTLGTVQRRRKHWTMKGTRAIAGRPNKSQQLHVYGGITAHGKTKLVYVTGTTSHTKSYYNKKGKLTGVGAQEFKEVMQKQLVPQAKKIFADAHVSQHTWLIDNAPTHSAKTTKQYFSSKGIQYTKNWPPNSPDLNPIENVWAWMKHRVYAKHHNTLAELKAAVQAAWADLPDSTCKTLMHSLQRRKDVCLERDGGYADY